jgi:DNA-binding NarL/FixJ family response regulator
MIEVIAVDDEAGMIRAIQQRVSLAGEKFKLRTTTVGQEAVEMARKLPPDVLITDVVMPSMDGVQVFEEIKKVAPHVRCIAVTAFADREKPVEFLKHGARDFIDKGPNFGAELVVALKNQAEAIEGERLATELHRRNERLVGALKEVMTSVRAFMEMKGRPELGPVATALARVLAAGLGARDAAVLLVDRTAGVLMPRGVAGCGGLDKGIPIGVGIAGRVAVVGRSQIVAQKGSDPVAKDAPERSVEWGRKSVVAVPLTRRDEVIGVIEVFDLSSITPEKVDFVNAVSEIGSAAFADHDPRNDPRNLLLRSLQAAADAVAGGSPSAKEAANTALLSIQPVIAEMDLETEDDRILAMAKMIREVQSYGSAEVGFCKAVLERFVELLRATRPGGI